MVDDFLDVYIKFYNDFISKFFVDFYIGVYFCWGNFIGGCYFVEGVYDIIV